jgi:chromate transport protein ChrA
MAELSVATAGRSEPRHGVSLNEAFRVWLKVALLSFGGPTAQIAVMHRILVDEEHWISENRFLHALNYCMLLPGPEAKQLAVYIGWLMHRTLGGIMAGALFVVPGVISIMALSYVYAAYGNVPVIVALFFGLKAAVLAIVLEAVFRIGKRSLKNNTMRLLAAAAFVGIFFFNIPFPIIILGAALIGFFGAWSGAPAFALKSGHGDGKKEGTPVESLLGDELPEHARPTVARALRASSIWLAIAIQARFRQCWRERWADCSRPGSPSSHVFSGFFWGRRSSRFCATTKLSALRFQRSLRRLWEWSSIWRSGSRCTPCFTRSGRCAGMASRSTCRYRGAWTLGRWRSRSRRSSRSSVLRWE